jgi:translin
MTFFDQPELAKIEKSISQYDEEREKLIQQSREIIKQSKVVINALHRNERPEKDMAKIEQQKEALKKQIGKRSDLASEGMAKVAFQEYAEAKLFFDYVHGKTLSNKTLKIDDEHYLLGICDFTGELSRRAVLSATRHDYDEIKRIHTLIEEIQSFFLKLNLRNSELRKKSDSIKWNLKRVEEVLYDISFKQKR